MPLNYTFIKNSTKYSGRPSGDKHSDGGGLYLESETIGLNTAISRLHREIDLLREYRTRLVADVVTGKLDVRAAAAALPQEEPEPALEPDATDLDDAEPQE